jgi:hypothetical protein
VGVIVGVMRIGSMLLLLHNVNHLNRIIISSNYLHQLRPTSVIIMAMLILVVITHSMLIVMHFTVPRDLIGRS